MPMYDILCIECGFQEDVMIPLAKKDSSNCPNEGCDLPVETLITQVNLIGPIWDKKTYIPNIDTTFTSKRALDKYCRDNNVCMATGSDPASRHMYDRVRNRIEDRIKAKGGGDIEQAKKNIRARKQMTAQKKLESPRRR